MTAATTRGSGRRRRRSVGAPLGALAASLLLAAPAPARSPDRFVQAWGVFKDRFMTPEGRIADGANRGVSHTEGQGYAMLLAVAADDGVAFSRLWGWTRAELYRRPDGLGSWRWEPDASPHLTDANNATDGDILVSWALLRAGARWNSPEYTDVGRRIARAVGRAGLFPSRFGPAIRPGVAGFDGRAMADGPVVNLSYWVFPALRSFRAAVPDVDWDAVVRSGLAILAASSFGADGLPTDWISVQDRPRPAGSFPHVFSYDAIRIPLYLVWADLDDDDRLSVFLKMASHPVIVDVDSGKKSDLFKDAGYRAVFALAMCAYGKASDDRNVLNDFSSSQPYYSSALQLLAWLAEDDRGLSCDRA